MLSGLLGWRRRPQGLVAVGFHSDGISLAQISGAGGERPRLHVCDFIEAGQPEDFARVLSAEVARHGWSGATTVIVPPLHDYKILKVERPDVPEAELAAAVKWGIGDLIDFPLEEAIVDVFSSPADPSGRPGTLNAVVTRRSVLQTYVDATLAAGLKLRAIDVTEFGLRNLCQLLPENKKGAAIVFLANGSGVVTLCRGSQLYLSRNIEVGTNSLHQACAVASEDAGLQASAADAAVERLVLEIQRSFDYYESSLGQPPVSGVVMVSLGEDSIAANQLIGRQLGTQVRTLDLNAVLDCDELVPDAIQARCLRAVGGALRPGTRL